MDDMVERPAVKRGVARQLAELDAALAGGAELFGWKLGLGAPAAQSAFELSGPLVGFLLAGSVQQGPGSVAIAGMGDPKAEPEVAVRLARRLVGDESDAEILAAVRSVGLAVEVVDVTPATRDIETVLAVNIFQRALIAGPELDSLPDLSRGRVEVLVDGELVRQTEQPDEMTGQLVQLLRYTARWLTAAGRGLDAGQVLILGSTVPPVDLQAGQRLSYRRTGFDGIDLVVG